MNIYFGLAFLVFLIGLVILLVQKRFNEIVYGMYLAGLIAVLLTVAGHLQLTTGR